MFYTLGKGRGGNVYLYALRVKQYVFSNEIIRTGIDEIDSQIRDSYPRTRITINTVTGKFLNDEIVYQGANSVANATVKAFVYDFVPNTHIDVYCVNGVFTSGNIIGATSSTIAVANVVSDTVTMDDAFEDIIDNNRIQVEAEPIIDWSETNPFGTV
jgi:acyl dehydratase